MDMKKLFLALKNVTKSRRAETDLPSSTLAGCVLFDVRLCSKGQSCQLEFTQKSTTTGTLSALCGTN